MGIQFEWRASDDEGQWKTIAEIDRRPKARWLRRIPRRVWYILAAVIIVVALGGYWILRRQYQEAEQRIKFQIQSVIDLQAQAFARGERSLFLAQLDEDANLTWLSDQRNRLYETCSEPQASPLLDPCYPVLPGRVESVEVRGEIALVQVSEGDPPVQRARFYRRVGQGWRETSPRPEFWQPLVETRYERLSVRCHRRDLPYVQPLLRHMAGAVDEVCTLLGCPATGELTVEFVMHPGRAEMPQLAGQRILVDTPWLLGIPADQTVNQAYLDELASYAGHAALLQAMQVDPDKKLTPLQQAVVDEFATWQKTQDVSQAPLMGRMIERRSRGPSGNLDMPSVMRSLSGAPSLSSLVQYWLDVSPMEDPVAFFQTLLDIEREALLAGRESTFTLLQAESGPEWMGTPPQQWLFADARRTDGFDTLPRVEVAAVDMSGAYARVTLKELDWFPLAWSPVEFYRLQENGWKHTMPYYALDYIAYLESQPEGPARDRRAVVRFACADSAGQEELIAAFEEQHPDIRIETVPISEIFPILGIVAGEEKEWEWAFRLLSRADVVCGLPAFEEPVKQGWVHDLTPWMEATPGFDLADFYGGLPEQYQRDGGTWALPLYAYLGLIFYDRTAFDATRVPYPQAGWTQDEFLAAALALTEREGDQVTRYGFADAGWGDLAMIEGRAGSLMAPSDPQRPDLAAPHVVDAVRWYTDLGQRYQVMPYPQGLQFQEFGSDYSSAIEALLAEDKVAMWTDFSANRTYRSRSTNLGLAPMPRGRESLNPLYDMSGAISANTAHPHESWLWLEFLTRQYRIDPLYVPVRHSAAESQEYQALLGPELAEVILYALEHTWVRSPADLGGPLRGAIQAIYGGQSVEQALVAAQALALKEMQAGEK